VEEEEEEGRKEFSVKKVLCGWGLVKE